MDNTKLAADLFAAIVKDDAAAVRSFCTPDLSVSQNHGPAMDLDTVLGFSQAVHQAVSDFRYEDAVRASTADGFIEEHVVCGTLPDGQQLRLAVCVVADVRDGKVCNLREYFDGAAAAGLIRALSQIG